MDYRRLLGLTGPVLTGLLVLGGCAEAPAADPANPVAGPPSPAATTASEATQAPCTTRLRRDTGSGGSTLTLTPEIQAEIDRLRSLPPDQQAEQAQQSEQRDPALAARLAEARAQAEGAARPCADR